MKTSKKFNDDVRAALEQYAYAQYALDKEYDAAIEKLEEEECTRLSEKEECLVTVGSRVWCSNYKRPGTVIGAELGVSVVSDDYYADRVGPGRYMTISEEYDASDWGDYPEPSWVLVVQPDPSPKRGQVPEPFRTRDISVWRDERWVRYSYGEWHEADYPQQAIGE